jgi:phenylacetate-coenzyme A ligase PaaK-like adenylate-forming protein
MKFNGRDLVRIALSLPLIKYYAKKIEKSAYHPYENQEAILKKIVKQCGSTELGRRFGLDQVNNMEDARRLPVTNYELILPDIKRIYEAGTAGKGILSWSPIEAFTITSGTSGGMKYFPITKDSLEIFKLGGLSLYAGALNSTKNHYEIFKGKVLFLNAAGHKFNSPTGLNVGYMSGYVLLKRHWLYRDLIFPTPSTVLIEDSNERMRRTLDEVKGQDIHIIMGFPAIIQLFISRGLAYYGIENFRQIWPNLKFCVFGGNYLSDSLIDYIKQTWTGPELQNDELIFLENYSAVEGFFGHTLYPEWPGMVFNSSGVFFQFKDDSDALMQLHELKKGGIYSVYITSLNGLINYAMDDLIEITSTQPLTFKFFARTKEQINVIGEKINLNEIRNAINQLAQYLACQINDFVVYVRHNTCNQLVFVLSIDLSKIINVNEGMQILDNIMRKKNPVYNDYRTENLYQLPQAQFRPPEFFNAYREKNINKGNFKEKRLFMSEAAFNEEYP